MTITLRLPPAPPRGDVILKPRYVRRYFAGSTPTGLEVIYDALVGAGYITELLRKNEHDGTYLIVTMASPEQAETLAAALLDKTGLRFLVSNEKQWTGQSRWRHAEGPLAYLTRVQLIAKVEELQLELRRLKKER